MTWLAHSARNWSAVGVFGEWARQDGHKVANRGRIAANVIEAYEKAAG